MKKRILLLTPYFPYPAYDGGKVRIFNLIKNLSKKNELILVSYVETLEVQVLYTPFLEKFCKKVYTVIRDENKRLISEKIPRSPTFYYTSEMIDVIEKAIAETKPDIVQIEFLNMTQYVNHIENVPVIYTEHDMSSIDFEQSFHDRDIPEKLRFIEWTRLVKYQKEILRKFNGVVVLTDKDKAMLDVFVPGLNIRIVPTGVDIHQYTPVVNSGEARRNIIFIGHFKHYPNVDAVKYFMEHIWQLVLKEVPDAKFYIVGSGVNESIRSYSSDNVIVAFDVEDVKKYLCNASVFVAPVRLGGGIKGKVLEAMACGVPVVATAGVCAGFVNNPGYDIVKAEGEHIFAKKIVDLLKDTEQAGRIALQARKLVEDKYNWEDLAEELDKFYDSILKGKY